VTVGLSVGSNVGVYVDEGTVVGVDVWVAVDVDVYVGLGDEVSVFVCVDVAMLGTGVKVALAGSGIVTVACGIVVYVGKDVITSFLQPTVKAQNHINNSIFFQPHFVSIISSIKNRSLSEGY